jgi:hypothetical protein
VKYSNAEAQNAEQHLSQACQALMFGTLLLLLQAYQNLPTSGKLEAALDDVKQAAAAAGFKPRQSGWGEHV